MTDAPPPRPKVPPLGPVIEGTVVADSLAGVPGANLPPAPQPAPMAAAGGSPFGAPVAPGVGPQPLVQPPVLSSFVGGAIYAFLVRTVACVLSLGFVAPVNGMLTGLLRSVNAGAGVLLLLGEFLLLGVAALAGVVVGVTASPDNRASFVRALFFGRVYFWGTAWYLATVAVGGVYVLITDTRGGGVWLLLLGCLSIPSLFGARKIIRRTRWVTGRTD
jgi:hypothetical protein